MQDFYQLADARIFIHGWRRSWRWHGSRLGRFCGRSDSSGIEKSLDLIDFDRKAQKADLVVVGEGRMDLQSLSGKAPVGVAKRTPEKIPVLAICGSLADDLPAFPSHHIEAAFSIVPGSL